MNFWPFSSSIAANSYTIISPKEGDTFESSQDINIIILSDGKIDALSFSINSITLIQLSDNSNQNIKFDAKKIIPENNSVFVNIQLPENVQQNCQLEIEISGISDKIKSKLFKITNNDDYDLMLGSTLKISDGVKLNHFYGSLGMFKDTLIHVGSIGVGFSAYISTGESFGKVDNVNRTVLRNPLGDYNFYSEKTEQTNSFVGVGGAIQFKIYKDINLGFFVEYRRMALEYVNKYKITKNLENERDSSYTIPLDNDEHNLGPIVNYRYKTKNITFNVMWGILWTTNSNEYLGVKHTTHNINFLLKENQSGISIGGRIKKIMFDENTNPTEFLVYIGKSFSLKNFFEGLIGKN